MKIVRSIQLNPDSIDLAYMEDTDIRLSGNVFLTHHMSVQRGSEYDDEISQLEEAAESLVNDVLIDFATSPPHDPSQDVPWDDDDDDE